MPLPIRPICRPFLLAASLLAMNGAASAATFTVTHTGDGGAGSLRWAIDQANAAAGTDTIAFNLPGSGVRTLTLASALPALSTSITLDATTQPGYAGTPLVELAGAAAGTGAIGLHLSGGTSTVRGLLVNRFDGAGLRLTGGSGHRVESCVVGLDAAGNAAGNASGIVIDNSAGHTVGPGNVVSGNRIDGVTLRNAGASGNRVIGNHIGTSASGTAAAPNTGNGIAIILGAHHNTVGGSTAAHRNIVSGNTRNGIAIGSGAHANTVARAFVGLAIDGVAALGNGENGVLVLDAPGNFIGGDVAGTFNAIAGNGGNGVEIRGATASGNVIRRSVIGTTLAGTAARPNAAAGVRVDNAPDNFVGEGAVDGGPSNLISGNAGDGVLILPGSDRTRVLSNHIGTDVAGNVAIANRHGVRIDAADAVSIDDNLISGNWQDGIDAVGAADLQITNNFVGTNAAGTARIENEDDGVNVEGPAGTCTGLRIGTLWGNGGNLISGNANNGIDIGPGCAGTVSGNRIGTNVSGTAAIANFIGMVSAGETLGIGGIDHAAWTCDRTCNLISGNQSHGLLLTFAQGAQVRGNFIGLRADGQTALPNASGAGIVLFGNATIGGSAAGTGNVISGNGRSGIEVLSDATHASSILGNRIGTNAAGSAAVPNGMDGIRFDGGTRAGIGSADHDAGVCNRACNLIAGNGGHGIFIDDHNLNITHAVLGNFIGTNLAGSCLGNGAGGVRMERAGSGARIGGVAAREGNRIACNIGTGVTIAGNGARIGVRGNGIHANTWNGSDAGIGIDLATGGAQVTENDPGDTDTGPNLLQNFPVLTDAVFDGTTLDVQGTLDTRPNRTYAIDVYRSASADPTGFGEGEVWLGTTNVTTDASGHAAIGMTLATAVAADDAITATATDAATGSTSEFSRRVPAHEVPRGQFSFSGISIEVSEGAGTLSVTVHRANGDAGTVGVHYATEAGGSATPGSDYIATSGVLSFDDGVTSRSFTIPILDDTTHELQEDIHLRLSQPTGGATLGLWPTAAVLIADDDSPTLHVDDGGCAVTEGDAGETICRFVARLSSVAAADVTFDTTTANADAVSGDDYTPHVAVSRRIAAGSLVTHIDVPILGDRLDENDETFVLHLGGIAGATLAADTATGTIVDDDATPGIDVTSCGTIAEGGDGGEHVCAFWIRLSEASGRELLLDYWTEPAENLIGDAGAASFEAPVVPHISTNHDTGTTFSGWHVQRGPVAVAGNGFQQAHRNQSFAFVDAIEQEATEREIRRTLPTVAGTRYRLSLAVSGQDAVALKETDVLWEGQPLARITYDASGNTPADMAWEYHSFDVTATQAGSLLQFVGRIPAGLVNTAMLLDDVSLAPPGSASSGIDYVPTSSNSHARLSVPAGATTAVVTVLVRGDAEHEGDERLRLRVCDDEGHCSAATATIRDDDAQPMLAIGNASVIEGDDGTATMTFDVTLQPPGPQTVTVDWSTADGTATHGRFGDYAEASGTLDFAPGQAARQIRVQVNGDTVVEDDETLRVNLASPQRAGIADGEGVGTILDDDLAVPSPGRIEMRTGDVQVGERAGSVRIELQRTGGDDGEALVLVRTGGGDAQPGVHYGAVDGFSLWADGAAGVAAFDIPIHDDGVPGPDRDFFLILSEPAGAVLGTPDRTRIVIRDGEVFIFADGYE